MSPRLPSPCLLCDLAPKLPNSWKTSFGPRWKQIQKLALTSAETSSSVSPSHQLKLLNSAASPRGVTASVSSFPGDVPVHAPASRLKRKTCQAQQIAGARRQFVFLFCFSISVIKVQKDSHVFKLSATRFVNVSRRRSGMTESMIQAWCCRGNPHVWLKYYPKIFLIFFPPVDLFLLVKFSCIFKQTILKDTNPSFLSFELKQNL